MIYKESSRNSFILKGLGGFYVNTEVESLNLSWARWLGSVWHLLFLEASGLSELSLKVTYWLSLHLQEKAVERPDCSALCS